MKRVLITGGLGFIGSHVAQACIDTGFSVRLLDNLSAQIHGPVPRLNYSFLDDPKVEVARGDIGSPCDWQPWLEGVDCVVHLAAETGTAQSMYRFTGTLMSICRALRGYRLSGKQTT